MNTSPSNPIQLVAAHDVLVIEIHNPPINAGTLGVRQGILDAIEQLSRSTVWRAGVIIGAGSTFIAGSDLKEFGQPLENPQLPAVIAAIEQCAKPVVAAIHGAALGGGFELALGCDARVADVRAVVGLPEVTLGMIPGAGGTQRLPRRVGLAKAIELICAGTRLPARQALDLGLLDQVVDTDLRTAAVEFARTLKGRKRRLADENVPAETAEHIIQAEQAALRAGRNRPPVRAAIKTIKTAITLPLDEALLAERKTFNTLRLGPEAHALRHLFFAERNAMKPAVRASATPRSFQVVAVIGSGTMGTGIAIAALDAGLSVVLIDQEDDALERGRQRVLDHYKKRVAHGRLKTTEAASHEARLLATTDWSRLGPADIVIEAVFEELAVKQAVFRKIDGHAKVGAVLATNTSYLDIDAIAASTTRPQDVLGLHFFSPANVMKLLEVVRGEKTATDAFATGMALGRQLKKMAVPCGNAFGFIGNRLYDAYRRQCEFMLEDGAWPEEVDQALQEFGFAMGPFSVADLSGLDIAWRMRRARATTRDPRERYVDILDLLCEQGRLGRKSGAGYYLHTDDVSSTVTDSAVRGLIESASARRGIVRRTLSAAEIQRRALLAIVNEAAHLLFEGVAERASDIDVVLVHGYGFPRWEGGPVFWARRQPRAELLEDLTSLVQTSGHGARLADISCLLEH
ncbi:MAG: 3-hydroxyacyl-CoA dehydrogenase NAD-binding domain-containing protein [Hydrogenophaga sp.]|uniref:3-hydroxyacyl-CoA dehydrogenase NAD-binding domain-containing protein n=1 Tax=Hydrogenophaga sp. TaxID=1904254 RepID=UPI0027338F11|nr:3-hydroxyacyl-CoA dehydrogenase NAD-binding domain-containing protein [Hydrogenophaga sp.]MDP3626458.1 3-hydroxyacyl-CoA dehydrogenase NAD-binding domain-containing protein [Hydrogenophaga sp.]